MSGFIAVNDLRRACLAAATSKRLEKEISQLLSPSTFYLEYNKLGFFTGRPQCHISTCYISCEFDKCIVTASHQRAVWRQFSTAIECPSSSSVADRPPAATGVDKDTWSCEFLLPLSAAEQLVDELEDKLECSLNRARQAIQAAPQHNWAKYDNIQSITIPTQAMYNAIIKSFAKLARQSKTQVRMGLSWHSMHSMVHTLAC